MARSNFKFDDLETWIGAITSEVAEEAAGRVIEKLQLEGPYWTGEFAGAWEAQLGEKFRSDRLPAVDRKRRPRQTEDYVVQDAPEGKPRRINYAIGNHMEYELIAKDLIPDPVDGKYRKDRAGRTVVQDWYRRYLEGGGLATTLELATQKASRDPKIRNFRGNLNR